MSYKPRAGDRLICKSDTLAQYYGNFAIIIAIDDPLVTVEFIGLRVYSSNISAKRDIMLDSLLQEYEPEVKYNTRKLFHGD